MGVFSVAIAAGSPRPIPGVNAGVHSLVLTNIVSGWTEAVPIVARESTLVVETLDRIRIGLPFVLRALDVDYGCEFVNDRLIEYCLGRGSQHTRSRPYRRNDQPGSNGKMVPWCGSCCAIGALRAWRPRGRSRACTGRPGYSGNSSSHRPNWLVKREKAPRLSRATIHHRRPASSCCRQTACQW